jgi:hypothetical protein
MTEAVRKVRCRECQGKGERVDGRSTIKHAETCSRYRVPQRARQAENFELAMAMDKAARQPATPPSTADTAKPRKPRTVETSTDSGADPQAAECVRLRDELHLSWMAIGAKLSLPGSKSGAANARRLYKAGTGVKPQGTVAGKGVSKGPRTPKHAGNEGPKVDRKLALMEKGHVLPLDLTDEEVVALVAGKTIEWGINLATLCPGPDQWCNQEARVHPTDVLIQLYDDETPELSLGSRVLRFREFLGYESDKRSDRYGEAIGGNTRTVRVNAIHTIR